jgi:hypothetical protein
LVSVHRLSGGAGKVPGKLSTKRLVERFYPNRAPVNDGDKVDHSSGNMAGGYHREVPDEKFDELVGHVGQDDVSQDRIPWHDAHGM